MLSFTFVRVLCLASFFFPWTSFLTNAAPIPINDHTKYASTRDAQHHNRLVAHDAQHPSRHVHPGAVNWHGSVPGEPQHITGTIGVDPAHQHHMRTTDVHAHVAAAKQNLIRSNPHLADYEIHGHHTPGDAHVMLHATPRYHNANGYDPSSAHHAVRHPGPSLADPSPAHHRLMPEDKEHIRKTLNQRVFPNGWGNGQPPHPHAVPQPIPGAHGEHTGVTTGKIPAIMRAHKGQGGLSAAELQMHAEWVHRALVPQDQQGKVHVHVTHSSGKDHVEYHIAPAKTGSDATHAEIQSHLNNMGDSHYKDPITWHHPNYLPPNGDHGYTFKGKIPAHTKEEMTPEQLSVYADHAKNELIRKHNLQGVDAHGMVVAATHKAGDNHVYFHTQPKTGKFLQALGEDHTQYPAFNAALTNAGHTAPVQVGKNKWVQVPWHHAELGALRESLDAKHASGSSPQ